MAFKSEFHKEIFILQNGKMKVFFMERNGCSVRCYFGNLSSELTVSKWARFRTLARARSRIKRTYKQLIGLFGYSKSINEAYDPVYGVKHTPYKLFKECKHNLETPISVIKSTGGVRVIVCKNGSFYRNGRRHAKIESFLGGELVDFFKRNPTAILDGEIYPFKGTTKMDNFLHGLGTQKRVAKCRFLVMDGFNVGCSIKDQYSYRLSIIKDYVGQKELTSVCEPTVYDSVNQAFNLFKTEKHFYGYIIKENGSPYGLISNYGSTIYKTHEPLRVQVKSIIKGSSGVATHIVSSENKKYKIKDTRRIREGISKREDRYIGEDVLVFYEPESVRKKRTAKFFPRRFKIFSFFH